MPAAVQFVQEGWLCSGASRVGCGEKDVAQAAQHNSQHYTQPTGQHYTPQHSRAHTHTHPGIVETERIKFGLHVYRDTRMHFHRVLASLV